jgi:hypothetical protein
MPPRSKRKQVASPLPPTLRLWCWDDITTDPNTIFIIEIEATKTVDDLKREIKKTRDPALRNVDHTSLVISKVNRVSGSMRIADVMIW